MIRRRHTRASDAPDNGRRGGKYFSQQGVALLAVTTSILITAALVKEFATNTTVDYFAANNARDEMRAHFYARSALNMGELIIAVQTDVLDRFHEQTGGIQIADYTDFFMGAFGGGKDEAAALGAFVGIGGEALEQFGLPEGDSFDVEIGTEDGKINVNCANASKTYKDTLQTKLQMLIYPEGYNRLFEEESADGWRRDRQQQVAAIMDYIDTDRAKHDAPGSPEDYGYESLPDPYSAKNNYLDSVEELKLVRGVDDRFWTLFGSSFTVYGSCKENLAAITDPKLIAAIIALTAKDPEDPILREPTKLWALANRIIKVREFGLSFNKADDFAKFVADPNAGLEELLGGEQGAQAFLLGATMPDLSTLAPVEGVELDTTKLGQIVESGPRKIYRVTATAQAGRVQTRIVGIWDKDFTNQNPRNPQRTKGAWMFLRED